MKVRRAVVPLLLLLAPLSARAEEAAPAPVPDSTETESVASASPATPATSLSPRALGEQRGVADAENPSTAAWSAFGFGSGCLFGPLGFVCSPYAAGVEPTVPNLAPDPEVPLEYADGYRDGYRERLRERRRAKTRRAAGLGAAITTTLAYFVTVLSCNEAGARMDHSGCAAVPGTKQFGAQF